MSYSAHDIRDCFYQFSVPEALSAYLCLRPLTAAQAGVTSVDGVSVSPSSLVYPQIRALPMGFNYALHWAQTAHLNVLNRCQLDGGVERLFDFNPAPSLAGTVG